jgi:hypothetical protein
MLTLAVPGCLMTYCYISPSILRIFLPCASTTVLLNSALNRFDRTWNAERVQPHTMRPHTVTDYEAS